MKNVLKTLAKIVLIPLWLTAAASTTDAAIQKKIFGSGMTTHVNSNEEMDDIMKIVRSLGIAGLLITSVSETIQNEAKKQEVRFLGRLLSTIGASLLGNPLESKRVKAKIPEKGVMVAGEGTIRAGEGTIRTSQNF